MTIMIQPLPYEFSLKKKRVFLDIHVEGYDEAEIKEAVSQTKLSSFQGICKLSIIQESVAINGRFSIFFFSFSFILLFLNYNL